MPNRSRKPAKQDVAQTAFRVMQEATGQAPPTPPPEQPKKNPAAVELGRLGGLRGGKARAAKLSPKKRSQAARKAAQARWANNSGK